MTSIRTFAAALAAAALLAPAAAHAAGDLDPGFDGDGRLVADLGAIDTAQAVAYQPDGKILVAGEARTALTADFVVLRYNADGTPDNSFDGDGRSEVAFGPLDRATAIAVAPGGDIVVAGSTNADLSPASGNASFAVARLDANGQPDASFSGDGRQIVDFGAQDLPEDLAVEPGGGILVGGSTLKVGDGDFAWARLEADGDPDPTFDNDGRATIAMPGNQVARSVAIAGDGTIAAAGQTTGNTDGGRDFTIVRLTPKGKPDPSFSDDGFTQVSFGTQTDDTTGGVAVQSDGRILAAGATASFTPEVSVDFAAVRVTSRGDLDPSFGGDGRATIDGGGNDGGQDAELTSDGGLAVAGLTLDQNLAPGDFAFAEFRPDGSPDPRFGGDGVATADLGSADAANAVAVADGRLVAAGTTIKSSGGARADDLAVASLTLPRAGDPFPSEAPPAPGGDAPQQPQPPAPPTADTTAPALTKLKLARTRFAALTGTRGSFRLTEPARVTLTIQRRRGRKLVKAGAIKVVTAKAGTNKFKLKKVGRRRLARGSYRLTASAVDAAGNKSKAVRLSFRVR